MSLSLTCARVSGAAPRAAAGQCSWHEAAFRGAFRKPGRESICAAEAALAGSGRTGWTVVTEALARKLALRRNRLSGCHCCVSCLAACSAARACLCCRCCPCCCCCACSNVFPMLRRCLPSARATPPSPGAGGLGSPQRDALPLGPEEDGGAEAAAAVADELAKVGDQVLVPQPPAQEARGPSGGLAYSCRTGSPQGWLQL